MRPRTRYAQAGELSLAYEVVGRGPVALRGVPEKWELFSVRRGSTGPP